MVHIRTFAPGIFALNLHALKVVYTPHIAWRQWDTLILPSHLVSAN